MNTVLKHIAAPLMTVDKIVQLPVFKVFDGSVTYVDKSHDAYFNVTDGGTTFWFIPGDKTWHKTVWAKLKTDGLQLSNLFTHQKNEGVFIETQFMHYFFFLTLAVVGVIL